VTVQLCDKRLGRPNTFAALQHVTVVMSIDRNLWPPPVVLFVV